MLRINFMLAALIMGVISFVSCDNQDDLFDFSQRDQSGITELTMKKISTGEMSLYLEMESHSEYKKDARTGNKWKEIPKNSYVGGGGPSLSKTFYMDEGRVWVPYKWNNPAAINPLYMPWIAYCNSGGYSPNIYIVSSIDYDESTGHMLIGDKDCIVLSADDHSFKIRYDSQYAYDLDYMQIGDWREIFEYKVNRGQKLNKDNILFFETEQQLFKEVITLIRDRFGNEFNLNDYFYPDAILDNPVVNMDEIEKELLGE